MWSQPFGDHMFSCLPPTSRITPGRRGCVRTLNYGVCVFSSGELEHIFKICTYVRIYIGTYVRKYVTYVRMQIQAIRYARGNRSVVVLFSWLVFLRSDVWPCEGMCRMGMGGNVRGCAILIRTMYVCTPLCANPCRYFSRAFDPSRALDVPTYVRTDALTYVP